MYEGEPEMVGLVLQPPDDSGRVGRIEVSNNPNFDWLGTGFLAGADTVITNRHVAVEFSRNTGGTWSFRAPMAARIDFREELGGEDPMEFKVRVCVNFQMVVDLGKKKDK